MTKKLFMKSKFGILKNEVQVSILGGEKAGLKRLE